MKTLPLELDRHRVNDYIRHLGHKSLEEYQRWFGLTPDGVLGPQTATQLIRPRCGVPDHLAVQNAQWPRNCMDVPVAWEFDVIDGTMAKRCWEAALAKWNSVCGINMQIVGNIREAKIWATDGPLPGGTLAWSMLASDRCNDRLEQRYDTLEVPYQFEFLAKIIFHEVGHALGLEHTNQQDDIMFPSISNRPWSSYPSQNDIARVVARYGPNTDPQPPPPDDEGKVLFEYSAKAAGEKIRLVSGSLNSVPDWGV